MKKLLTELLVSGFLFASMVSCNVESGDKNAVESARAVIERAVGKKCDDITIKQIKPVNGKDTFSVVAKNGRLTIKGSSPTAICYAFNTYLKNACHSMVTWGGANVNLPEKWADYSENGTSPYKFRYFLNVCTYGYTMPYWDWNRWEKEIDLMALHGVNMPLASVASEAIAKRVWLKMGLTEQEIDSFFTGAAHLPWHRMGNLNSFDGPLTENWHKGQIEMQHKIIDRMRQLGMTPVAPAFAGFVPQAFLDKHPDVKCNVLEWGGFEDKYKAAVLSPDSPYFKEIGKLFIEEWEKEFGKNTYYLSDSFNEMELPLDPNDKEGKYKLLADYGEAIYQSIAAGDKDAVWVTQGWTFGYQYDFWDKPSLQALLSRVPDDKMIIVDLGNDYPKWIWHTEPTWKVQEGFWGKGWIYSYVPNFGGKILPTGELAQYASGSVDALNSPYSKTMVGFGSAPEGLENNEVVYELLADMGWSNKNIDLDSWIKSYCTARYGSCSDKMFEAWNLFRKSVYGSLYSYPRFTWQTVIRDQRRNSANALNDDFGKGVKLFLECSDECGNSPLYRNDAIEFASLWLGEVADRHYETALTAHYAKQSKTASEELEQTVDILQQVDKLLASHPLYKLSRWVDFARGQAVNDSERQHYESNAKRLITTWGGTQEDYAARFWNGLIGDYYIPRLEIYFSDSVKNLDAWEERWINTPYNSVTEPYADPIANAKELVSKAQ